MGFLNREKTAETVNVNMATLEAQADSNRQSLEQKNEKEVQEHPDEVTGDARAGVQKAEATALVWTKKTLYSTYACTNMIYYAHANLASAPQISQAYVVSTIVGGVLQLPIAKILNVWGRTEGVLVFLTIDLVGVFVIASCNGPNGFAAGYTLWYIGYSSLKFILSVFVADASGLKNRAFVYAFIGTRTICTTFSGSIIAQAFPGHLTWRWSYGCFTIITVVIFLPLAIVFKFYPRKAVKLGLLTPLASHRTIPQSNIHYIHEFDLVGGALLMAAFILFLLPFSLQTYGYSGYSGYSSMTFIAVLLRPRQLHQVELLRTRTVLGACVLSAIIFFNYNTSDQYSYYYIQVMYDLDTSKAWYMTQIYGVGSTIWAVLFGVWIRTTKYFKHGSLFFGAPLLLLGAALMIHFHGAQSHIGFLVMCQIFIAVGGGTLVLGDEMAVMAATDRDGVPLMIAMISLSGSVGGALGYAVASAIHTNTFPEALLRALPDTAKADYATIYSGGSAVQLTYPPGSAERDAINYAWAYSQKYECITAACLVVLAFPAIAVWKNHNLDKKQVKGIVI
ncbi:hypothetical protein CBS147353_11466 [Aspergillus niger]|nr:hypothetical protein CBS147353_11466 [Aspergillus niger]